MLVLSPDYVHCRALTLISANGPRYLVLALFRSSQIASDRLHGLFDNVGSVLPHDFGEPI
jgi:hypothetical protein